MTDHWHSCKNILCIRPDNIGDLLMTSPAITALKETFGCRITVLTSSMAVNAAAHIPAIDEAMVYDVPWVKGTSPDAVEDYYALITSLKKRQFDAAIIFTVFSQSPLPSAMIAYHANIPKRLAYCRENPYKLLTHWIPDKEPYSFVQHQVVRDLQLVRSIGAKVKDDRIKIEFDKHTEKVNRFFHENGLEHAGWIIFHPGVSESKREYPANHWITAGKCIAQSLNYKIIITGAAKEKALCDSIATGIGNAAFSTAGVFTFGEFIDLISRASLIVSVNTSTIHIAAAVQTKMIVLYALTNPQHTPWKSPGMVLPFSVDDAQQSRNEILKFVQMKYFDRHVEMPTGESICEAVRALLTKTNTEIIPDLVMPATV